jgi:hypothetical protein
MANLNVELKDNNKCEVFSTIFQHMKLFSDNINIHFKDDRLSVANDGQFPCFGH